MRPQLLFLYFKKILHSSFLPSGLLLQRTTLEMKIVLLSLWATCILEGVVFWAKKNVLQAIKGHPGVVDIKITATHLITEENINRHLVAFPGQKSSNSSKNPNWKSRRLFRSRVMEKRVKFFFAGWRSPKWRGFNQSRLIVQFQGHLLPKNEPSNKAKYRNSQICPESP